MAIIITIIVVSDDLSRDHYNEIKPLFKTGIEKAK